MRMRSSRHQPPSMRSNRKTIRSMVFQITLKTVYFERYTIPNIVIPDIMVGFVMFDHAYLKDEEYNGVFFLFVF